MYVPTGQSVHNVPGSESVSARPGAHSKHELTPKRESGCSVPTGHTPSHAPVAFATEEYRPGTHNTHGVDESESSSDCPASQLVQFIKKVEPGAAYVPLAHVPAHSPVAFKRAEYRP